MSVLFEEDKKCVVEGHFDVANYHFQAFFDIHELDYADMLIVRRELLPSARSRAFVNDSPVSLKVLQELMSALISMNRQFTALDLFDPKFQMRLLDSMALKPDLLSVFHDLYEDWKKDVANLRELESSLAEAVRQKDFEQFQLEEIDAFAPNVERDAQLKQALQAAESAGDIKEALTTIHRMLAGDTDSLSDRTHQVKQVAFNLEKLYPESQNLNARIESVYIELRDIAAEAEQLNDQLVEVNLSIEDIRSRYDELQRLLFKHRLEDVETLVQLREELASKFESHETLQHDIESLKSVVWSKKIQLQARALELRALRMEVIPAFEKQIHDKLSLLSMPNATLHIALDERDALNEYGMDTIQFLFSANPGSALQPIQQVASGGELSRLSLAIKSIVASKLELPTMIFDEIDSGVSGETALRMGQMLHSFGASHQMIVITHSPQVAAMGGKHFLVSKSTSKDATQTSISLLKSNERIYHIAAMLSGASPSEAAIQNAKELLATNEN